MKRVTTYFSAVLTVVMVAFIISCQTEPLGLENEALNAVNGKTKIKKEISDSADENESSCETAFAKGVDGNSTCFIDIEGINSNRWGWTVGPLTEGTYTFDIYAGAGQCDTSKGELVGALSVDYLGGTANVNFTMNNGSVLSETHLYVGNDPIPSKNGKLTVAPGQFPYSKSLDNAGSDSYTVANLSGEIYVIAHAVVCKGDTTTEECIVEPIQYCDGVRYNFWGLGTFWGGNYSGADPALTFSEQADGSIHITGESKMNASRGCLATVDVWLINPKNFDDWTAGGGMAHIPEGACATVTAEDLKYYIIDESRSSLVVSDCADADDDLQANYDVLHAPQDQTKGFQIGNGGSLFNTGDALGLSGWFFLRKEGTDVLLPADFNFLLCE